MLARATGRDRALSLPPRGSESAVFSSFSALPVRRLSDFFPYFVSLRETEGRKLWENPPRTIREETRAAGKCSIVLHELLARKEEQRKRIFEQWGERREKRERDGIVKILPCASSSYARCQSLCVSRTSYHPDYLRTT